MKPHIILTKDAPKEGIDYKTPCGAGVVKAKLLRGSVEPGSSISMWDFRGACPLCLSNVTIANLLQGRYLGFAVDGQAARESEAQ